MEKFIQALTAVVISGVVIASYYIIRAIIGRKRQSRAMEDIRRKVYHDERSYVTSYLFSLVNDMAHGEIHWLQLFAKKSPSERCEIIYDAARRLVVVSCGAVLEGERNMLALEKIGVLKWDIRQDRVYFLVPVNGKIVADLTYFILEKLYGQQQALSVQIKKSGE
jgi:hypothetical protein